MVANAQDKRRFENLLKATKCDLSYMSRMIQGDAAAIWLNVLLEHLGEKSGCPHIPRYVLIGYGDGYLQGDFEYIESLSEFVTAAVKMHADNKNARIVDACDLDERGIVARSYSELHWLMMKSGLDFNDDPEDYEGDCGVGYDFNDDPEDYEGDDFRDEVD